MTAKRPLDGIRVLDLSRLLPGPYLTMTLGDMGADVVKVEAPVIGDYMRQMPPCKQDLSGRFLSVNRNKRSLVLDLKTDTGRETFLRMVERADVVVESFRPGVIDRLGIGYEAMRERRRDIIVCSISGFGQSGPYRERAGHDLNYVALSGVLAMGGERAGAPAMPGVQIADLAGGALWSATAILAALVGRERGAGGAHLDISMTEGAMALLAAELGNADCGIEPPTRGTQILNGGLACYSIYETADGKYLAVGALEPKFWLAFNQAIGRRGDSSEVIAPPAQQEVIRSEVAAVLRGKTQREWAHIFSEVDCCTEPVLELEELEEHPVHRDRAAFFTIDGGSLGPVKQLRTPVGRRAENHLPPRLGEHSAAVLSDYGFTDDEIRIITE